MWSRQLKVLVFKLTPCQTTKNTFSLITPKIIAVFKKQVRMEKKKTHNASDAFKLKGLSTKAVRFAALMNKVAHQMLTAKTSIGMISNYDCLIMRGGVNFSYTMFVEKNRQRPALFLLRYIGRGQVCII